MRQMAVGTVTLPSELLEPETVTWMSLWNNGELVVAKAAKDSTGSCLRFLPLVLPALPAIGLTFSSKELDGIGEKAVRSHPKLHGLFGVESVLC